MTFTPWFDDENSWMMPTEVEDDSMTALGIICAVVAVALFVFIGWITKEMRR